MAEEQEIPSEAVEISAEDSETTLDEALAQTIAEIEKREDEEIGLEDDDATFISKGAAPDKNSNPLLEAMIAAKNEAVEALEQTQKEAADLQDRLLRASADFENYKKRQMREREESAKYANEKVIQSFLPAIDNLMRATDVAREQIAGDGATPVAETLLEGVEMVSKLFTDALSKLGAELFTSVGEPFDPARHEAVAQLESNVFEKGQVMQEYHRGCMLHERLIRPAMVVVSQGPGGDSAED